MCVCVHALVRARHFAYESRLCGLPSQCCCPLCGLSAFPVPVPCVDYPWSVAAAVPNVRSEYIYVCTCLQVPPMLSAWVLFVVPLAADMSVGQQAIHHPVWPLKQVEVLCLHVVD